MNRKLVSFRKEVQDLAIETFETKAVASEWMATKIISFGYKTPASFMRSREG